MAKASGGALPCPLTWLRIRPGQLHWPRIREAARAIQRGQVVASPTDTLYGLAADPFQPKAVQKLFQIKRRPENRPVLLLIDSLRQLRRVAPDPPAIFFEIAENLWPGPLTVVLPAAGTLPRQITAGTGTVAVRLPAAPLTRALIRVAGRPLTGTSANRSGRPPAENAREVERQLRGLVHYIVDGGPAPSRTPSTILDLTARPRILRQGAAPLERLARYLP